MASLLVDRWSETWSELAWLRLTGPADLVEPTAGAPHAVAIALLRARYPQYLAHPLESAPLIRITVSTWTGWEAGASGS